MGGWLGEGRGGIPQDEWHCIHVRCAVVQRAMNRGTRRARPDNNLAGGGRTTMTRTKSTLPSTWCKFALLEHDTLRQHSPMAIVGNCRVRREVAQVIVRYEETSVDRTCDSVRSSPAAPARLVTVGSEAAVTTALGLQARRRPRGSLRDCQRYAVGGSGSMTGPTNVNCFKHRNA